MTRMSLVVLVSFPKPVACVRSHLITKSELYEDACSGVHDGVYYLGDLRLQRNDEGG